MTPTLARTFMAYIACTLGSRAVLDMIPTTDSAKDLRALYVLERNSPPGHLSSREMLLEALLPTPAGNVSARDLEGFKTQHHDNLSEFRNWVEEKVLLLAATPDDRRPIVLQGIIDDGRRQGDEVAERIKRRGWRVDRADLLTACAGAAIGGVISIPTGSPLPLLAALPPVVEAAYKALRIEPPNGPMAYAALAGRRWPLSSALGRS
jgi:hypothetical protein